MRKAHITILILLSGMFAAGLMVPSSTAEIYKYVDKAVGVHQPNIPDVNYSLEMKESWVRFQPGADFEEYDTVIWNAAERYGVDYALVKAVIKAESNFNPRAVSRAGAKGLMQLMPGTANALGVDNSFHPEDNIQGGVRHLRYLLERFKGDLHLALAAYNSGEKVVLKCNGIPPYRETRKYIKRVMRYFQNYSSELRNPDFL
ncbi:MAG: lytic transglycosylase domain-containing protein [Deltaproteobacteria bacterium]|nr:lytic transglycosylase domain-containing protein [Deltaproteobacteria bacterium]